MTASYLKAIAKTTAQGDAREESLLNYKNNTCG
jgi:hypothetical protein